MPLEKADLPQKPFEKMEFYSPLYKTAKVTKRSTKEEKFLKQFNQNYGY